MPFYEYECQSCKFYTEVMQKITDAPLTKCPSCGKKALQKLVSAPVFRLKGSGWYETDFKSDKENKRNLVGGADKDEPKADAPKADAKADAKPDTKGETKPEAKESKPEAKPAKEAKAAGGKSAGGARRGGRPAPRPAARAKPKKASKARR
jgi:putative FmdB family regulatory protein